MNSGFPALPGAGGFDSKGEAKKCRYGTGRISLEDWCSLALDWGRCSLLALIR